MRLSLLGRLTPSGIAHPVRLASACFLICIRKWQGESNTLLTLSAALDLADQFQIFCHWTMPLPDKDDCRVCGHSSRGNTETPYGLRKHPGASCVGYRPWRIRQPSREIGNPPLTCMHSEPRRHCSECSGWRQLFAASLALVVRAGYPDPAPLGRSVEA